MAKAMIISDRRIELDFDPPVSVSGLLEKAGVLQSHPCGGRGVCWKCVFTGSGALSEPDEHEKEAGVRLSCRSRALGDCTIRVSGNGDILVEGKDDASDTATAVSENSREKNLFAAVDIGTTTVVLHVLDAEGNVLSKQGVRNPQSVISADVMGRISASLSGKGEELKRRIRDCILSLLEESGYKERIFRMTVTGNTTMLYLFTGRDPKDLSAFPFEAGELFDKETELDGIPVYLPPCMHAFVGADITSAVLASGICEQNEISLLIDVGTNGEIALWKSGTLYVTSTAAGPVFEGAGISCGVQGIPGAVEHVAYENGTLKIRTINDLPPVGLCGSGLMDAVACFLESEEIDETGALEENELEIAPGVTLNQKDIRNVQLGKAAVCAGIDTVLEASETEISDVVRFEIAGGFGAHINVQSAGKIGLFPEELCDRAKVLGNAALRGAELLLSEEEKEKARKIAAAAVHVNLGGDSSFNEHYIDRMMFE